MQLYPLPKWLYLTANAFLAALLGVFAWSIAPAMADNDRIALVIGNSKYFHFRSLPNADNDARLLHATLTKMGFDAGAEPLTDLTKLRLERALQSFARKSRSAKVAVIYYAGHGMEISGKNFLIPIDAELVTNEDADYEAIDLDLLMKSLGGVSELGLVLLDACRNDPFRSERRTTFRSSSGVPFAEVRRSAELSRIAVGFAAASGALAADGNNGNSPYATALAKFLPERLEFDNVLAKVGREVERLTGGLQSPYVDARSALLIDIYLTKPIELDYKSFKEMLAGLGYYTGAVDSKWDEATRTSLEKFQADNHLPETGDLDLPSQAVLTALWRLKEKQQEVVVASLQHESTPATVIPPTVTNPTPPPANPLLSTDVPNIVLPPVRQPKPDSLASDVGPVKEPVSSPKPKEPLAFAPEAPPMQGNPSAKPADHKPAAPNSPVPPITAPRPPKLDSAPEKQLAPSTTLAPVGEGGVQPTGHSASAAEPPPVAPIPVPRAEEPKQELVVAIAKPPSAEPNRNSGPIKPAEKLVLPLASLTKPTPQPDKRKRPAAVVKAEPPAVKSTPTVTAPITDTVEIKIHVPDEGVQVAMIHPPPVEVPVLPRNTFRDCQECPLMVRVPAGTFLMGSPEFEPGRDDDEGPQHTVSVSAFAMGKFEVTFAEWDACIAAGGCGGYNPRDFGWGRGNYPVIEIRWEHARDYVNWLNSKVPGSPYRLPSEAEWEYAARAGSTSIFFWGNTISPDFANYAGSVSYVGGGNTGVDHRQTLPVGSFAPNASGLFDMLGNVKEWTQDIWHESYYGAPTNGSAWMSGAGYHVLRGGSWCGKPQALRAANRLKGGPDLRNCGFGFRVARTLPE